MPDQPDPTSPGPTTPGALPPDVRGLLEAVRDALGVPAPATDGDHPRYSQLLERRAMLARVTLDRVLGEGGPPLDLGWEVAFLRERLNVEALTGYKTGPWPGTPVDQAEGETAPPGHDPRHGPTDDHGHPWRPDVAYNDRGHWHPAPPATPEPGGGGP